MSSTANTARTSKGSVAILNSNGRLQLRFNYAGKRRYLSLGLPDTKANRAAAELKAKQIERDIAYGEVDTTLAKYKPSTELVTPVITPSDQIELDDLWSRWVEFRRPQIEAKTLSWFQGMGRHIDQFPTKSLDDAAVIRDHVVANISPDMGKRLLTRINACCKWALKSGLITYNPFEGMASEIQLPKATQNEDFDIDPFSKEEQDAIVTAFKQHRRHQRYVPFIRFLLLTGCRPSEAIGLQWKHIRKQHIQITEPVVCCQGKPVSQSSTKTGQDRQFPINHQMRELLDSISPEDRQPNHYVFGLSPHQPINYGNFYRAWHGAVSRNKRYLGIVTQLAETGVIQRYRHPYQCRHTFITQCLEAGVPIPQVAKWVGNSPAVIMRHYAGVINTVAVPEF